jgi:hypothetical protein
MAICNRQRACETKDHSVHTRCCFDARTRDCRRDALFIEVPETDYHIRI